MTKSYKFVFIDLDDTLWDFHTNARRSLELMFVSHGLNNHFDSFDTFFDIYAKKNIELWEAYGKGEITREFLMTERFRYPLSKMGVNNLELSDEIGRQYLNILPEQTALMPFAIEILDYLSEKYPLTIISNGFVEVQYRKLRSSDLGKYFQHIVLSQEAKALKPDPEIFRYALKLNGANAEDCIMIGDSYAADIVGAGNANIDQVYYPLNGNLNADQKATHIISSLKELYNIL